MLVNPDEGYNIKVVQYAAGVAEALSFQVSAIEKKKTV